ncbi:MAG TPA: hypothetical protein V6C76_01630 [Drouetiella sp.]
MRRIKRLFEISLSVAVIACGQASFASQLAFTTNGANITAFEGDVDAKSVGTVALPKGTVSISGNAITVNAVPDWLFDKHAVLSGVVINSKLEQQGTSSVITGIAFFTKGEWLPNLGRNQASEVFTLSNGSAAAGHVLGTSATAVDIMQADGTRRTINFADITAVSSQHAFDFRIPASSVKIEPSDGSYTAEVTNASFGTSMLRGGLLASHKPQVPKSTLPGTEGGVSNKYIAAMIATDILVNTVAPAVAIPITFTRSTLHARQLEFINSNNSVGQKPFTPIFYDGTAHFYPTK